MPETLPEISLHQGDCTTYLPQVPDRSVDLILTDPPYDLGSFVKSRNAGVQRMRQNFFGNSIWDDLGADAWEKLMDDFFSQSARILKIGGAAIVFMSVIKVESLIRVAQNNGFYYKTVGIWHKTNPMPRNMNLHFINSTEAWVYFTYGKRTGIFNNNQKAIHDFIETCVTPKSERKCGSHPTQKPLALMEFFVKLLSNPGDTVLDPFMGSGSSGVAAVRRGRNFIGVELNDEYFSIATTRIKDATL